MEDDDLRPEYDLTKLKVRRVGGHQVPLDEHDDLLPHYDLDYSKSKPNRFAEAYKKGVTRVILNKEATEIELSIPDPEAE